MLLVILASFLPAADKALSRWAKTGPREAPRASALKDRFSDVLSEQPLSTVLVKAALTRLKAPETPKTSAMRWAAFVRVTNCKFAP